MAAMMPPAIAPASVQRDTDTCTGTKEYHQSCNQITWEPKCNASTLTMLAVQLELLYMTQNVSNGSLLWLTGPGVGVGLVVGPSVGITGLPPSSVVWSERAVHMEKLLIVKARILYMLLK